MIILQAMPQCPHCNKNYGVSSFLIKCDTCSCTWCKDGNCPGAMKKKQFSRNNGSRCGVCNKGKIIIL